MIVAMQEVLKQWKYGREILLCFVKELSDEELDTILPRKNLNTIRKHVEELLEIQESYIDAIESKHMSFKNTTKDSDLPGMTGSEEILKKADELDKRLERILEKLDGSEAILWFGQEWNIMGHLNALMCHEQMHIGQIIAFCYAVGINIPSQVINTVVLSG